MSMTIRQARARVGRELGIILTGVATAVTGTSLNDTSSDSPFDPSDVQERLNGAAILVHVAATGLTHYRQNVSYSVGGQGFTWVGSIPSIAVGDAYEIHLEPLLHPLLNWPDLIEDALKLLKFVSWQEILLTGRGYYDMSDYPDIDGPEQIRRLYDVGSNLLLNGSFEDWPTTATVPTNWSIVAGTVTQNFSPKNYRGLTLSSLGSIRQTFSFRGPRRVRVVVWAKRNVHPSTVLLTVDVRNAASGTLHSATASNSATAVDTPFRLAVDVEVEKEADSVRVTIENTAGTSGATIWAPLAYDLSDGLAQRIQPITTLIVDDVVRLFVPEDDCVAQLTLLLPYTVPADDGTTVISTSLPDRLLIAALAVQVLRFLIMQPQLPDRGQYQLAIGIWEGLFERRHREHMRKIAKTQQRWEAGEQAHRRRGLR